MRIKDHRIKQLETVCLSKQRRVEYPERNVIYMLTTEDHRQRRTYIIGKAKNLTNRLSTYNKTCDHTVVHHRECKNEDDMDTAETMVLAKLRSHREQANRDRFILPEDKDESFFSQTIDECVRFLEWGKDLVMINKDVAMINKDVEMINKDWELIGKNLPINFFLV